MNLEQAQENLNNLIYKIKRSGIQHNYQVWKLSFELFGKTMGNEFAHGEPGNPKDLIISNYLNNRLDNMFKLLKKYRLEKNTEAVQFFFNIYGQTSSGAFVRCNENCLIAGIIFLDQPHNWPLWKHFISIIVRTGTFDEFLTQDRLIKARQIIELKCSNRLSIM